MCRPPAAALLWRGAVLHMSSRRRWTVRPPSIRFALGILGFLLAPALATSVSANPVLSIVIQPIQVCDDNGLNCANTGMELFEEEGDKIWAQAGLDLYFLDWVVFSETDFLDADFGNLLGAGHGQHAQA